MPNDNGKLSESDKRQIANWLNERARSNHCPSCGSNNWSMGDDLFNLMPYTGGGMIIGGPTYPVVFLVCNHCAYVRQYMAMPMGIFEESSEKSSSSDGHADVKLDGQDD